MFGTNATELVHIGQAIMGTGGTLDYLVDAVFNYPTLSEAYKVAALDAVNKMRAVARLGHRRLLTAAPGRRRAGDGGSPERNDSCRRTPSRDRRYFESRRSAWRRRASPRRPPVPVTAVTTAAKLRMEASTSTPSPDSRRSHCGSASAWSSAEVSSALGRDLDDLLTVGQHRGECLLVVVDVLTAGCDRAARRSGSARHSRPRRWSPARHG